MQRRSLLTRGTTTLLGAPFLSAIASPTFSICIYPIMSSLAPVFAARTGMFERAGLHVSVRRVESTQTPQDVFREHNCDMVSGASLFLGASAENVSADHRFFAFNGANDEDFIDSMVSTDPDRIRNLSDLRGRRLLISASAGAMAFVTLFLLQEGLAPHRDVTILRAASVRFAELLREGHADAALALEPWGSHLAHAHGFPMVQRNLIGRTLFGDGETHMFMGGHMVNSRSIARHRPEMAQIAGIWRDACALLRERPDLRSEPLSALYPDLSLPAAVPIPRTVLARDLDRTAFQDLQSALITAHRVGIAPRLVDVTGIAVAL